MSTEPSGAAASVGAPTDRLAQPVEVTPRHWNWGAFVFTWLWGLFNGAYWPLLGLLLAVAPSAELWRHDLPGGSSVWVSTGTMLNTAWSVFCGLMGDRWAARGRRWRSVEEFRRRQHAWAVAALVAAIVLAVLVAVGLILAVAGVTSR